MVSVDVEDKHATFSATSTRSFNSFSRSNEVRKHAAYPPPPSSYPPPEQAPTYVAPPPAGYPTRDGGLSSAPVPIETKSRGDGFWKGW